MRFLVNRSSIFFLFSLMLFDASVDQAAHSLTLSDDINAFDANGKTALIRAIEDIDVGGVELLLSKPDIDPNVADTTGNSPLMILVKEFHYASSLDTVDQMDSFQPYQLMALEFYRKDSAEREQIIKNAEAVEARWTGYLQTKIDRLHLIYAKLAAHPTFNPNTKNFKGQTPLQWCRANNMSKENGTKYYLANRLLKKAPSEDVGVKWLDCCYNQCIMMCQKLIVDPRYDFTYDQELLGNKMLRVMCALNGPVELVRKLLQSPKSAYNMASLVTNMNQRGDTPALIASNNGDMELLELLHRHGASMSHKNNNGCNVESLLRKLTTKASVPAKQKIEKMLLVIAARRKKERDQSPDTSCVDPLLSLKTQIAADYQEFLGGDLLTLKNSLFFPQNSDPDQDPALSTATRIVIRYALRKVINPKSIKPLIEYLKPDAGYDELAQFYIGESDVSSVA